MTKEEIQKLINKSRDAAEVEWADGYTGGREAYIKSGRTPIVGVWIRRTSELVAEAILARLKIATDALKLYAGEEHYEFWDGAHMPTVDHGNNFPWEKARAALLELGVEIPPLNIAKVYDKEYGDDKECECGHPYYRHFDSYDRMAPVGCKYCPCVYGFTPKLSSEPETTEADDE